MAKRSFSLKTAAFLLIIVFLLPACGLWDKKPEASPPAQGGVRVIELPDIIVDSESATRMGYDSVAHMENASYYFSASVTQGREDIIRRCETLLIMAKSEYGGISVEPLAVCVYDKAEGAPAGSRILNYVYIDPNNAGYCQPVLQAAGGEAFPAWLAYGLGRRLLRECGFEKAEAPMAVADVRAWAEDNSDVLPPFGDAWVIPDFFDGSELAAESVYSFVDMLAERKPSELENLLIAGDVSGMKKLWEEYSESSETETAGPNLRYTHGGEILISTNQALYTYKPAPWTWEQLKAYTYDMDKGIQFARDFMEVDGSKVLDVMLYPEMNAQRGGSADASGKITIYYAMDNPKWTCAHEASHSLGILYGMSSDKTAAFFNEGIAQLTMLLFCASDGKASSDFLAASIKDSINNPSDYAEYSTHVAQIYETITQEPFMTSEEIDPIALADAKAIAEITDGLALAPITLGHFGISSSSSYLQAQSFCYYLYITYGKDAVFALYKDGGACAETTGKALSVLLEDWKEYLGIGSISY